MLDLIVEGTTYSLDDGTYCYFTGDDGTGMAQVKDLAERGPQQHGDSDRGYYMEPRFIRLFLDIEADSFAELYQKRQTLLGLFRPSFRDLKLRYTLDTDFIRQIDCHFIGDMQMPSSDQRPFAQKLVVGLKANDPTWYDPTALYSIFQIGGGADTWEVPFEVPFTVGASTIGIGNTINYLGNAPCYPVIRIVGPLEDAIIYNKQLDLSLSFDGTTIAGGDYYEIDLRYGRKTVLDAAGANQIADLTSDSDLAEFRLAPDPDAPDGENTIIVEGTSATTATKVTVTYYNRYVGI